MNELPPPSEDGLLLKLFRLPRPILGLILVPIGALAAIFSLVVFVVGYLFLEWLRH